ncbi:MAG TPA: Rv3235 family protein [Streptosporangiaceae bacterium]|nr:Rv3235 family protein [Streptosporangiaceae bacterium]
MQQTPPPQPPRPAPEVPAGPAVVPILPTRIRQPGRQAPLPDAVAVRRLTVPDPAPPFDDEILALETDGNEVSATPAAGPAAAAQTPGQGCRDADASRESDSEPPRPPGASGGPPGGGTRPPDPGGGWPSQFAQVLAETLAGSRPAQQLTPWTTEQARRRIRQLGPMLATDQRPKVRRVMTSAPAAGVLEMTAVVGFGPRVRAVALRLERETARPFQQAGDSRPVGDRWCCTAVESA